MSLELGHKDNWLAGAIDSHIGFDSHAGLAIAAGRAMHREEELDSRRIALVCAHAERGEKRGLATRGTWDIIGLTMSATFVGSIFIIVSSVASVWRSSRAYVAKTFGKAEAVTGLASSS